MRPADCIAAGGVIVFPTDTVYGLCCDALDERAVTRLYELKGRPAQKPAALLFTALDAALAALPELGPRTRAALAALLPGPYTLLVPNPARRYPLAGGELLGVRVIDSELDLGGPVLQSSANRAGGPDARRLEDVPPEIREGADLVIDGGELPGLPSTVVELAAFETSGAWKILRRGTKTPESVAAAFAKLAW
jgi:L-threonylcarbamoyladenylate synthase